MMCIKEAGDKLRSKFAEAGYPKPWTKDWCDDYLPLPEWKPSKIHEPDDEYDLIAIYYKLPQMTFADLANTGWVSDILQRRPDIIGVQINTDVAARKGIKTGDKIAVESHVAKTEGIAFVTDAVHPSTVAISNAGRPLRHPWAIKNAPLSSALLECILTNTCKVSGGPETAARVKVYKAE